MLFDKLYALLEPQIPVPDLVIHLVADVATCMERIRRRARNVEKTISRGIHRGVDRRVQSLLSLLQPVSAAGGGHEASQLPPAARGLRRAAAPPREADQGDRVLPAAWIPLKRDRDGCTAPPAARPGGRGPDPPRGQSPRNHRRIPRTRGPAHGPSVSWSSGRAFRFLACPKGVIRWLANRRASRFPGWLQLPSAASGW